MSKIGSFFTKLTSLLFAEGSFWYLTVLIIVVLTILLFIFPQPEPISLVRYILGSVLVLFLPGYTVVKVFFQTNQRLDSIERFALSLGLSLAISPIVVLLLNLSSLGISASAIVLSLSALTMILATAAFARQVWANNLKNELDT